jgi:hypothetical protein
LKGTLDSPSWEFKCIRSILSVLSSDLSGVNPATLNGMILYYRLMTKWSGLGDSTELSRMGLSQSFHHLGYMEATERQNYRYYIKLRYTPPKGTSGIFVVAPSDGCLVTALRLALTRALRSRRVSSASKHLEGVVAHQSDRCFPFPPVRPTDQTGPVSLHIGLRP